MAALRIDIFEYKIGEMTEQTSQSRPDSTKLTRQYRLGMTDKALQDAHGRIYKRRQA